MSGSSCPVASDSVPNDGKYHFAIDRGGTFTDVVATLPSGETVVSKLLSEDPQHYSDAPTEGIRRVLESHDINSAIDYSRGRVVCTSNIGSIRMGTTVATNALLERQGSKMALVTTKGFKDLLEIGSQARPDIFDLSCKTPSLLYNFVVEVEERVFLEKFCPSGMAETLERKVGTTKEIVLIEKKPNLDEVKRQLEAVRDSGIASLAIVFLHGYAYEEHERLVGKIAKEMACFSEISMSHEVMSMVKMVPRGHTSCAAAYLTPKITEYLASFTKGFDSNLSKIPLQFMKSDGGLAPINDFGGHQAILSGPAGGVVGYAKTAFNGPNSPPIIGFDMGGTSTDVSRYDGSFEHVFETITAGVAIQAPQLDIHTVAAGGGSCLHLRRGLFVVGPDSAGAHPGPICYRKNGVLAVTDANVVLGRIIPSQFPHIFGPMENEPLDVEGARKAFEALGRLPEAGGRSAEELAFGFLQVANEAMCRPIRNLTQMKGFDITNHILACFGGAGPQHACSIAKALGMSEVYVHRYSGVLSAYGLSLADAVHEEQVPTAEVYDGGVSDVGRERIAMLRERAIKALMLQGYSKEYISIEEFLNMRYDGTDTAIMIKQSDHMSFCEAFEAIYRREFGFTLKGRDICVDDYRVRAVVAGKMLDAEPPSAYNGVPTASLGTTRAYFENGWEQVPAYKIEDLQPGHEIPGPCIIVQPISTVVVEINCRAYVTAYGDLRIKIRQGESGHHSKIANAVIKADPVKLSVFSHRFMGIAEQMGRTLQRTAISVNMKERLDFSCALFTKAGGLVANAPHIPVHLGAMQAAVRYQVEYWSRNGGIQDGDVLVSNHPQKAGGSHLPDITVITPVFHEGEIIFFVASRGHHADIGGISPGSMPPHSKSLEEEGAMIIAFKLVEKGKFMEAGITEILMSPGKVSVDFTFADPKHTSLTSSLHFFLS